MRIARDWGGLNRDREKQGWVSLAKGGVDIKAPGGWVGLVGVGPVDATAASLARPFFTTSTADVPHLPGVMVVK